MRKKLVIAAMLFVVLGMSTWGCAYSDEKEPNTMQESIPLDEDKRANESVKQEETATTNESTKQEETSKTENPLTLENSAKGMEKEPEIHVSEVQFDFSTIPSFSGKAYVVVNDNNPFFTETDMANATTSYESYASLDDLGRCGVAIASVGQDIMPTEERGNIGSVKPTGWHTVKYNGVVNGNYLFNRCHLLGFQLTGENANSKNLITGTRYMNVEGMLPFENMVADYVKETISRVLYRVTPVFEGENLVAGGVLMEARSVEDSGDGILFCVFVYNVQPGISIDYKTGDSKLDGTIVAEQETAKQESTKQELEPESQQAENQPAVTASYVMNTNSKKFHYPSCSSAKSIKQSNRQEFEGNRDEIISQGYEPCKRCNP